MMNRVGLVLVALVVGCGGSGTNGATGSSSGGTCTVTLSGAVTLTLECAAQLDDASAAGGPNVPGASIDTNSDVFDFNIQPVTTMTATYATAGTTEYVKGRVVNHATAGTQQEWNIVENDPSEAPNYNNVGTYNLQVTGISSAPSIAKIAGGNLKVWSIEGTLDATTGGRVHGRCGQRDRSCRVPRQDDVMIGSNWRTQPSSIPPSVGTAATTHR